MQLNDVTKRYDHDAAPALADVTMEVSPGESVAVMGYVRRNASGAVVSATPNSVNDDIP